MRWRDSCTSCISAMERAGAVGIDAIFDLHHQGSAAAGERKPHFRIGQQFRGLVAPADRRHRQPQPEQGRDEHRAGGDQQRHLDADQVGEIAPTPAADRDAAGNRGLERRQRTSRDPARRRQLHADVEQRDRQHPHRSRDHQRRGGEHRLVADRDRRDGDAHDHRACPHRGFAAQSFATSPIFSAPITAPMPKAPSMMP